MSIQSRMCGTPDCFRGERVAINRHIKFAAKHFEPANMIAVLVREQNAIKLLGPHLALGETERELPRAQSTINQQPAMIGRDQCAVAAAAAAEHGQTEHAGIKRLRFRFRK